MWPLFQFAVLAVFAVSATALELDVNNQTSILQATKTIVDGLYVYHDNASTVGQFDQPEPWYWWLSGAGWTSLIDYTAYTNDTAYVSAIQSSISQNIGAGDDFVPASQAGWEANDDQVYWVYSALTAMEYDFPALACDTEAPCATSWYNLSANAFNDFVVRWENGSATCDGGLQWQYDPSATGNSGNYKNSVTNGGFFQVAARLSRYTGNQTYADWANKIWDWSAGVGLIGPDFHVFDGTSTADDANCSSVDHDEWTYNIASYLHGAAHMYDHTSKNPGSNHANANYSTWESRVQGMISAANATFFSPFANATGIMYEQMCEEQAVCDSDQTSFKGSLANWMAKTSVLVPSVKNDVFSLLKPTALGAASACSGNVNGTDTACGTKWYIGGYDGQTGFGQELGALWAVMSLLIGDAPALATAF